MSFWLSLKRTAAKPAVIAMLCAILVCTFLCGFLTKDDGVPACGIVSGSDANAVKITDDLVNDGLIRFDTKEKLFKGIQDGTVAYGAVFPDNLTELLEDGETDEIIAFYASANSTFKTLYYYRIAAHLMTFYAPYLTSELLSYENVERSPEHMKEIIELYMQSDVPFEFKLENAEGAPLEADHYSYNLAIGTVTLLLFFAIGLFAVPYTEKQFLPIAKRIGLKKALIHFSLPSIACAMLLFFASAAVALILSDSFFDSGTSKLLGTTAAYTVYLFALGIAVTAIFGSTEKVRIPIMAICLLSLAFCPIFADIPALLGLPEWPAFLLPTYFFYFAKDSTAICSLIAILAFVGASALYAYSYKRKLNLK